MTDLEKAIWKASRGVPAETAALFTRLFAEIGELTVTAAASISELEKRIEALEAKRGPGRPKLLERVANGD